MSNKIYRIVFLGPQGSGKGTQAELLAKKLNLPNISTGNLYRGHIKNKTEIGKIAESYISQGKLAPTDLTVKMTLERLQEDDVQNGFILDGYPRDQVQYDALKEFTQITHAIEVWISDEEALVRIAGRRSCPCGMTYHLKYNPPKNDEICDKCGAKLIIRDDDKPDAIKVRLGIYHDQTEPLIELYKEDGAHIKIDGEQSIEKVKEDIFAELQISNHKI